MRRFHVLDLALAAMFVALMAIGANIVSLGTIPASSGHPIIYATIFRNFSRASSWK